jgi:hypothetical protein
MNTAIQDAAMLATLNISQWTARKYDKKVSSEVEKAHSAKDAGRFNKMLIAKEALEDIAKIAGAARTFHYKLTLAWDDNGPRLLPASMFMQYGEKLRDFKSQYKNAVDRFVRDYPALKNDAITRLGTMYNPLDYPDVSEIARKFSMEVTIDPIARADDFRVQLNEGYVKEIKREMEQRLNERQKVAVQGCWERVRDVVAHMHERLSDEEAVFRDSLINNARELVDLLPGLNFMNDPELELIRTEVDRMLVDPGRLREDKGLRNETAQKAADILARLPKL